MKTPKSERPARCSPPTCSSFLFQFQDSAYGWQGGKFHDDDEQPEKSKKSLEGAKRWARSFIKKNGGCLPIGGKVRIVEVKRTVVIESKWDSFQTNSVIE